MMNYTLLLIPLFLCYPILALAQTLTATGPMATSDILLELASKTVLPAIITIVGPLVAGLFSGLSPVVKIVIAGVVSMLTGIVAGNVPSLPLSPESSGNMGLSMGVIGEYLRQQMPKRDEVKKIEEDKLKP